ncbi:hypothetical protein Tco_1531455 [Tanacetum coccineum]
MEEKALRTYVSIVTKVTVAVVAGRKILVRDIMRNVSVWKLQGETFSTSVLLLTLGGYDMVLVIHWLSTFQFPRQENSFYLQREVYDFERFKTSGAVDE